LIRRELPVWARRVPKLKIRQLHGFHWYYKDGTPTRPVAINLIEGRLGDVIAFLEELAYTQDSTPGMRETYATWDERAEAARGWSRRGET
jgi:hypothetical protein